MTALERLKKQCDDLVVRYIDEDEGIDYWPLMDQLLYLGRHLKPSQGVVGKVAPASRPPGNIGSRDLYDLVLDEAFDWAYTLRSGARVRRDRSIELLPVLAQQRVDSGDADRQRLLHGRTGLYASVAGWHRRVRIFLGYDRPADHYPSAICPECHFRDDRGGSIRVRETLAWCANPDCHDDRGRRHEWSKLILEDLLRAAWDAGQVFAVRR